jgi:hypothetical protein
MEELEDIKQLPLTTEEKLARAENKVALYEQNGPAKLYYSLNRKANEMADLMNENDLTTLVISDPKDKTFDRLKSIWQDAASIATAVKELGAIAGITGDEKKDVEKKPFNDRLAESRT